MFDKEKINFHHNVIYKKAGNRYIKKQSGKYLKKNYLLKLLFRLLKMSIS